MVEDIHQLVFFEYLLKPFILLENKINMLQIILYSMFILFNVFYKWSPQANLKKLWFFEFYQVFDE